MKKDEIPKNSTKWESGGILLIRGKKIGDLKNLYAFRIKNVISPSENHLRVFLEMYEVHRIGIRDGKYTPIRVDFNPDYNKKYVGLSTNVISLNDKTKKTPKWRKTISEKNIHRICSEIFYDPSEWEDIKF